jgi:hypothetical protein
MPHPLVAKEEIAAAHFKPEDVLPTEPERNERFSQLKLAWEMNRQAYTKSRIIFDTALQTLEVIEHIWEITDNFVVLKGGVTLPIASVRSVGVHALRQADGRQHSDWLAADQPMAQ